jgi:hypothetical protein
MPADRIHPDWSDGQARFRADLVAYLDSLSVHQLGELLSELPNIGRDEPLRLGVLMIALNERLPDAYKLLPPAGQPGQGEGRRRSLRELVGDRRAARAARRTGPPPGAMLEKWVQSRPHSIPPATNPAGERRLGEALSGQAAERDQQAEGAMVWEDPGRPREPEPPAQGWRDWWLRDDER